MRGQKIPIAHRGFSSQSLISISTFLEHDGYTRDIAFVEIRQGVKRGSNYVYSDSEKIKMLLDAISLRAFALAMKDLVSLKEGMLGYKKNTQSGGSPKELYFGVSQSAEKQNYFINMSSNKVKLHVMMDRWELLSFSKTVQIMADELELALYKYQRAVKRNV